MKDKKRNCLVFLVLFICLTVCAQSSDEVKGRGERLIKLGDSSYSPKCI